MFTKKWTGDLVGLMHDNKISKTDLAKELNMSREYVSMVLNGHREPPGARELFFDAARRILANREVAS